MFPIEYSAEALRTLRRMPANINCLIRRKIEGLAADPFAVNVNVRPLRGRSGYRLRVGDWRVIYEIGADPRVMRVMEIGPRGSVYK